MTVIFSLYGNLSTATRKAAGTFERTIALKNFIADVEQKWVEQGKKEFEKFEKIDEETGIKFSCVQEAVGEKSSLKKVPHIVRHKITSEWTARGKSYHDSFVIIRFKPEKQEQDVQKT